MYSPPPYTPPPYYTPPPPPPRRSKGPLVLGLVALLTVLVVAGGVAFYVLGSGGTSCGSDGVTLNVSSSPEKFGVMQDLAEEYSGTEVNGACAQIAVQSKSSGEAMAALVRGWNPEGDKAPQPDVWTPAASTWVSLLRQRLTDGGKIDFLPPETPGVAVSPLVIAMPRPMAEALGWPNSAIGWSDILKLSRDPQGWGSYGHPEWGQFKLGKTNPNYSTSGLNATVGAYFAATEKSADLTADDLDTPQVKSFVRDVESAIVHYGDTTLTFLSGLQRADDAGQALGYVSAVAVEEMSVRYYNEGNPTGDRATAGKHAAPKIPLVAIYPKEGTIVSDHPYVALNTMDPSKKAIADAFLAFLRGPDGQARFAEDAFRGYDNKVTDLITQDNGLLPNQPAKMLAPPEPAVLDKVLRGWESLRKRSNVLWVVDVSGSMVEPVPGTGKTRMELAKASLGKAMDQFIGVDRAGLWEFATRIDGAKDYRQLVPIGPVSQNRAELKSAVAGLQPKSDTGLYDTALAAFNTVRDAKVPDAINSVVLLTDGVNDDKGSISLDALLGRIDGESGVRLFTIGFSSGADLEGLKKIAEATDAKAYDAKDAAAIDAVISAVTSNF
ncbi:Ca-activated chloride channel family protein [Actinocorallia herbida]|uniref:Ca-activated chloride channel family protein n=1 Tax=Actinocorallia herbida TaxID=58109 RepID=A0A3N1D5X9_9ACTN|nr:substrate-binding and VWA domain-containing protein [Actinocorallia herbida]ROO88934.1 Ca-activated chloride channel family protein [Actinocorallia herbida]